MKTFLTCLSLTLVVMNAWAGTIAGVVSNKKQEPIPGATVLIVGTQLGAVTNAEGYFEIKDLKIGRYTLEISSIGFIKRQQKVAVGPSSSTIKITLEDNVAELESVVIEGKSEGRELSEQPIQITSIDLNQFQSESVDVIGVLDRSAGLRVRRTGGLGSDTNIQLNGFTGRAVRLYYDGIPMELLGGGIQINNLPVNTISRIDVYKGVMPVDVGTDALAGGINVVPKLVETDFLDASYQIGSFNTHVGTLSATKVIKDNWFISFSGFYNYSDNDYENNVRNLIVETLTEEDIRVRRFHNQHQSSMASLQVGTSGKTWADQFIYSFNYNQRFDEIQHGVRLGNRPIGEVERRRSVLVQSLRYKKTLANDRLKLDYFGNFAFLHNDVDDSTTNLYNWRGEVHPFITQGGGNEIAGRPTRREGNDRSSTQRFTFSYQFNPNHSLTLSNFYAWQKVVGEDPLGFRITDENIDPNTVPSYLNRFISGLSYKAKWFNQKLETIAFGKFYYFDNQAIQITQVGGDFVFDTRVDGNDQGFGIGVKYNVTDDIFLRASYERALRIPDGSEVFGDFITIGANFGLRPEQSNNINIGGYFKHKFDTFRYISLDASYFIRDQRDLIRLEPGRNENDLAKFINEDEVEGQGIELTLSGEPIRGLNIVANFTQQDIVTAGEVNATNTNLIGSAIPNIPILFYNISARFRRETPWNAEHQFTISSFYNYVDEFDVILQGSQRNPDNVIPTQETIDLGLTYEIERRYSLSFQVNNLTNNEVFDNFRVPRPGINYSLKIRYLFQK